MKYLTNVRQYLTNIPMILRNLKRSFRLKLRFKNGDWIVHSTLTPQLVKENNHPGAGCSEVFTGTYGDFQPFSFLNDYNPDHYRHATDDDYEEWSKLKKSTMTELDDIIPEIPYGVNPEHAQCTPILGDSAIKVAVDGLNSVPLPLEDMNKMVTNLIEIKSFLYSVYQGDVYAEKINQVLLTLQKTLNQHRNVVELIADAVKNHQN